MRTNVSGKVREHVPCQDANKDGQCGQHSWNEIVSCSCGLKGPVCPRHFKKHFREHKDCIVREVRGILA